MIVVEVEMVSKEVVEVEGMVEVVDTKLAPEDVIAVKDTSVKFIRKAC